MDILNTPLSLGTGGVGFLWFALFVANRQGFVGAWARWSHAGAAICYLSFLLVAVNRIDLVPHWVSVFAVVGTACGLFASLWGLAVSGRRPTTGDDPAGS